MTIQRMDNVGIVVDDLAAVTAFFVELGLELEGEGQVEGRWAARVVGLDDVRVDIAMMRTADGHGRLELMKFHTPTAVSAEPKNAPANTLGIRRIMFAVEDIEDVIARLQAHGAELVGELEQYEDSYRLLRPRPRGHHRRAGRADRLTGPVRLRPPDQPSDPTDPQVKGGQICIEQSTACVTTEPHGRADHRDQCEVRGRPSWFLRPLRVPTRRSAPAPRGRPRSRCGPPTRPSSWPACRACRRRDS